MALAFSAATDRVEVADSATVRNLTAATYIAWAYLSGTANARFCQKGTAGAVNYRQFGVTSAALTAQVFRATTALNAQATLTNFAAWGTSKWVFCAGVHDTAGANGDQKLYMGDLAMLAAEPSSYSTQAVGSGATGDNTSNIQYLANGGAGTGPTLPGRIAILQIYNRVLTLAEIQSLQFEPRALSGCVGYWIMGNDATVTQADYSGNANAGTVTGATVADHVPLPPAFGSDWYTINPLSQAISATGIASSEAQGVAAASPGAVTLTATGIATGEVPGSAAVTPGSVAVSATGFRTEERPGVSLVSVGAVTLAIAAISSTERLGTATLTPGAVTLSPAGLATESQLGTPSVIAGGVGQTIQTTGLRSAEHAGLSSLSLAAAQGAAAHHVLIDRALFEHVTSDSG